MVLWGHHSAAWPTLSTLKVNLASIYWEDRMIKRYMVVQSFKFTWSCRESHLA